MPILGNKTLNFNIWGKGGKMGKKFHECHFRPNIRTISVLLEDFEIFDNFDHIFRPLKVSMTRSSKKIVHFLYLHIRPRI